MTRIVVVGLLAGHEAGLRLRLTEDGYALDTVRGHVRLLSELSEWLDGHGLGTADLSDVTVRQFVADRRAAGLRTGRSAKALAPILNHLAAQQVLSPLGVVRPE